MIRSNCITVFLIHPVLILRMSAQTTSVSLICITTTLYGSHFIRSLVDDTKAIFSSAVNASFK